MKSKRRFLARRAIEQSARHLDVTVVRLKMDFRENRGNRRMRGRETGQI